MADEEAPLIVDEELIELRLHRIAHAEARGGARHDGLQAARPGVPVDAYPIGADLPHPPYLGVDEGFLAAAIRSTLGNGDKLCGLVWQKGQRDNADTLYLQSRR